MTEYIGFQYVSLLCKVDGDVYQTIPMEDQGDGRWSAEFEPMAGVYQLEFTAIAEDDHKIQTTSEPVTANVKNPASDIYSEGYMGEDGGLYWQVDGTESRVAVSGSGITADQPVLVSFYNKDGKMLSVTWMESAGDVDQYPADTYRVKLFWIDGNGAPLTESVDIW